jgi:exonuclease-1
MGITGLLPALKSIMHKAHLNEYSGLRAGIDAYSWLHRGAHCCLMELALGQDTDK